MKNTVDIKKLTALALLTAIVIILQAFVRIQFGIFAISTVLIPIVIGGALYGIWAGAWLGLVFGATVLLSGDAAFFLGINAPGTIFLVIAKGILCGVAAAFTYKILKAKSPLAAAIASGIVCPIVNTGVFVICSRIFFYDSILYILTAIVGINFFVELGVNIVLNPVIMRLIKYIKKRYS